MARPFTINSPRYAKRRHSFRAPSRMTRGSSESTTYSEIREAVVTRYETTVVDGVVHVQGPDRRIPVGDLNEIIELVGGPAWTINYTDEEKQRYGSLNTADEGITVDVRDTIHAMTFGERFVRTLEAQPDYGPNGEPDAVSPRLGLFVGRLLENLEYGLR